MSRLIVIRGPSGVGKSTVANMLHSYAVAKTVLLPKDVFAVDFIKDSATLRPAMEDTFVCCLSRFLNIEEVVVIVEAATKSSHWIEIFDRAAKEAGVDPEYCFLKADIDTVLERAAERAKSDVVDEDFIRHHHAEVKPTGAQEEVILDAGGPIKDVASDLATRLSIAMDYKNSKSKLNSGSLFRPEDVV